MWKGKMGSRVFKVGFVQATVEFAPFLDEILHFHPGIIQLDLIKMTSFKYKSKKQTIWSLTEKSF